jgi:hypothetical protein
MCGYSPSQAGSYAAVSASLAAAVSCTPCPACCAATQTFPYPACRPDVRTNVPCRAGMHAHS